MTFLRTYLEPMLAPHRFQHQPYDHVLRDEERKPAAFQTICSYIIDNPVREDLAKHQGDWPFSGAVIPGYPKLSPWEMGYWEKFWRIYCKLVER